MAFFNKLKKDHVVNKAFNYEKKGTRLNFTLRVDIPNQLEAFEELLVEALNDVGDELKKHSG